MKVKMWWYLFVLLCVSFCVNYAADTTTEVQINVYRDESGELQCKGNAPILAVDAPFRFYVNYTDSVYRPRCYGSNESNEVLFDRILQEPRDGYLSANEVVHQQGKTKYSCHFYSQNCWHEHEFLCYYYNQFKNIFYEDPGVKCNFDVQFLKQEEISLLKTSTKNLEGSGNPKLRENAEKKALEPPRENSEQPKQENQRNNVRESRPEPAQYSASSRDNIKQLLARLLQSKPKETKNELELRKSGVGQSVASPLQQNAEEFDTHQKDAGGLNQDSAYDDIKQPLEKLFHNNLKGSKLKPKQNIDAVQESVKRKEEPVKQSSWERVVSSRQKATAPSTTLKVRNKAITKKPTVRSTIKPPMRTTMKNRVHLTREPPVRIEPSLRTTKKLPVRPTKKPLLRSTMKPSLGKTIKPLMLNAREPPVRMEPRFRTTRKPLLRTTIKPPARNSVKLPSLTASELPVRAITEPSARIERKPPVSAVRETPTDMVREPFVHTRKEPSLYTIREPPVQNVLKPPVPTNWEPPVRFNWKPEVHTNLKPLVYTDGKPPVNTIREPSLLPNNWKPPVPIRWEPPVPIRWEPPVPIHWEPPVHTWELHPQIKSFNSPIFRSFGKIGR